jgi:5-oxoprolinase (ATP-hydrolysing) subunit A
MEIDLNCDLGEGCPFDAELMPLITSASIACGFHAGDPMTAMAAMRQAGRHGVSVGAHPGYADRENFGRVERTCSQEQIFADCVYQIGALAALARMVGVALRHVKPHGALYNQACRQDAFAEPIVAAVQQFGLALMGLPGSRLEVHSRGRVHFIPEGFSDRRYRPDGSLAPRSQPDAFVEDPEQAVHQALWLLRDKGVRTLCVHGDNPKALLFVRQLRDELLRQGITLRSQSPEPSSC